ncbi:MAG: hypothetical protein NVSMB56_05480 [Pyrinomonadaceae bacterium]
MMTANQKILAAALTTALLGGTVGAFIARSPKTNNNVPVAENTQTETPAAQPSPNELNTPMAKNDVATNQRLAAPNLTTEPAQQNVYRNGFDDGYQAAHERKAQSNIVSEAAVPQRVVTRTRYVERGRTRYVEGGRRYYEEPRRPSFVQRHRDLLTVAGGAGTGAIIGGLIGGKRGAGIGALAGGGGAALYTYKLRRRPRRY